VGDGPAAGGEPGPADFLRQIADALTSSGFLVLRFADRDLSRATLEDLAADARAAVEFLRARPEVGPISIVGHDEGGLVASLVAGRDPAIKSVALLAAPGKTLDAMLLEAAERDLRAQGTAEAVLAAMLDKERRTFESIRRSSGDFLDIDERRTFVGWMRDRFRHDPAAALKKVTVPVVILQGARDPLAHADLLKAARPDASVRLLDGLDHHFRGPDGRVSPDFLKALAEGLERPR
jgi:pimeloyl-ACP methyl ester carboxylesterase